MMYKKYKKEQEQLKNLPLRKKKEKIKTKDAKNVPKQRPPDTVFENKINQKQDVGTNVNKDSEHEQIETKKSTINIFRGIFKKSQKAKKSSPKTIRQIISTCIQCFRMKKSRQQKSVGKKVDFTTTDERPDSKINDGTHYAKKVAEKLKVAVAEDEINVNEATATTKNKVKKAAPILTISSELYGLNKTSYDAPSTSKTGELNSHKEVKKKLQKGQKVDSLKTEAKHRGDSTYTSAIKLDAEVLSKVSLDDKETVERAVVPPEEGRTKQIVERRSLYPQEEERLTKSAVRDASNEEKTVIIENPQKDFPSIKISTESSFISPRLTKEETSKPVTESLPRDRPQTGCPICQQNAATVASFYSSEVKKETGGLCISINNYYSDKGQQPTKIGENQVKVRTVQTSVRPRTQDATTMTDVKFVIDNIWKNSGRCAACRLAGCDEKITICRSRRK